MANGMTSDGRSVALLALLNNSLQLEVGLLTALPSNPDAADEVEVVDATYARVVHQSWVTHDDTGVSYRANNGNIEFAAFTADVDGIVGWGIYDEFGDLIVYGPMTDGAGNEVTVDVPAGDQFRFLDEELQVTLTATVE